MTATPEVMSVVDELEPIARAFRDEETGEWVVDWNQKFDLENLPPDVEAAVDKEAKVRTRDILPFGYLGGGMSLTITTLIATTSPIAIDALMVTLGTGMITGAHALRRASYKNQRKHVLSQGYGSHEQNEERRIRVHGGSLWLDPSMVELDLYDSIKDNLSRAYGVQNPSESPFVVLEEAKKPEQLAALSELRISTFKDYFNLSPGYQSLFDSEAAAIEAQLRNPVMWERIPAELSEELESIGGLEIAMRAGFIRLAEHEEVSEGLLFSPSNAVKQAADDPKKLETIMPELLGYVGAVERIDSIPLRTRYLAELATSLLAANQRDQIFS